jgi:signal peptidase II
MSKRTFVLSVAMLVLVTDQLSKWYVQQNIPLYERIAVVDHIFHLTHVRNTGGAFSLFADAPDMLRIPFFLTASALAIGALVHFLRLVEPHERLLQFALAGVLGGALGNLIDRVMIGSVTDFVLFHYRGYHWPAFNVADSFISIGVAILLLHSILAPSRDEGTERGARPEHGVKGS